ncbi:hypothetical protein CDAR_448011 [Caerostris darwini]|uniref:Uncharacterized protein n=1 Tax=Caerostris darwini TaxID=1538125 RepID=A0AAV4PYH1_9ARAC|nr:hypothetical protein CDAR_448011 [Caerostris darwini]
MEWTEEVQGDEERSKTKRETKRRSKSKLEEERSHQQDKDKKRNDAVKTELRRGNASLKWRWKRVEGHTTLGRWKKKWNQMSGRNEEG